MSVDLDTTEGRKQYIADKLDDLLDTINESYGTLLMEELLNRLEITIRDFNEEMKTLCDQLVKNQEEREQLLEMLKSNEEMSAQINSGTDSSSHDDSHSDPMNTQIADHNQSLPSEKSVDDIPVWEKKLANLEKK